MLVNLAVDVIGNSGATNPASFLIPLYNGLAFHKMTEVEVEGI